MKLAVQLALFIFIAFLSTPTIVSLIEKKSNTSAFFSMAEEEQPVKELKEVKAEMKLYTFTFPPQQEREAAEITTGHELRHDNITPAIFSPPPNV
jgi:hypothetical protein